MSLTTDATGLSGSMFAGNVTSFAATDATRISAGDGAGMAVGAGAAETCGGETTATGVGDVVLFTAPLASVSQPFTNGIAAKIKPRLNLSSDSFIYFLTHRANPIRAYNAMTDL